MRFVLGAAVVVGGIVLVSSVASGITEVLDVLLFMVYGTVAVCLLTYIGFIVYAMYDTWAMYRSWQKVPTRAQRQVGTAQQVPAEETVREELSATAGDPPAAAPMPVRIVRIGPDGMVTFHPSKGR